MFLDNTMNLKVGNFSKASHLLDAQFFIDFDVVNLNYFSPQILKGISSNTLQTDIWAYGIILFELLFGVCPFDSKLNGDVKG